MKLSLDWIKDYVRLPDGLEVSRLMYDLTMSTVEVEGAENLSDRFKNIVVGVIEEIVPHPNADKLRICRTDIGGGEIKEIVCGGVNLNSGMKTAVAKPGAFVRWHGEGGLVEIKNAKLRGVESYGMICASSEIGLFDLFPFKEEATIMDLSGFDARPGDDIAAVLGLEDVLLEIDNKSLTNRPDLWGHYGIARELSALYDVPLLELPEFSLPSGVGGIKVVIDDPGRCSRYLGVKIDGVSAAKMSSFVIQSRIWRVGMRPINALVDVTNYVMLAVGQPTHAFDSGNIEGGITVRKAGDGERLILLNGKEVSLSPDDLVIADDREAVALAGIMGGVKDSILDDTTSIILEIANFEPIGLRKTAQKHDLRTEASVRYEKGIDPQRADQALKLACSVFASEFPDMNISGCYDNYPRPLERIQIDVSLEWLARRMGKRLDDSEINRFLDRLGFSSEISGDTLRVSPPSWRSTGDISIPDDIMEEVARLHGYENFEPTRITATFERSINQRDMDTERGLREYLSYRCGMQEVFTYPWVRDEYLDAVFSDREGMLEISTPPAPDERFIRSSLLPNLLEAASGNARHLDGFAIYELSQVFFDRNFSAPYDERELLPEQRRRVTGVFVSKDAGVAGLFRRAKGTVEGIQRYVHVEPLSFIQTNRPHWADETVWLNISSLGGESLGEETVIGSLALLSKRSAMLAGIRQSAVIVFDIDVESLVPLRSRTNRYTRLPEYPQVEYDISMLFGEPVKWESVESAALGRRVAPDLVRSVSFIDEYRGRQIPDGKKSITLRLVIGSDKKTLTSDEIEAAAAAVKKRLSKQLGGEIRT
ncbi:MAG: phenylalanine--tRNA ligase subunit beta [Synergistaceae bacterium]|jgi:phenylalanyl-tRNA synthetase beta chain|nr:phenylalanine--tRNA ligase subunit beta [Synergistaceae bacterium]